MKKSFLILFVFLFLHGCKKEPLTGDYQPLMGEWLCTGVQNGRYFENALKNNFEHTLLFNKDGTYKIINKQDGGKTEKGRIKKIILESKKVLSYPYYLPGSTETVYVITLKKQFSFGEKYLDGEYHAVLTSSNNAILSLDGYRGFHSGGYYAVYERKQ